MGHAAVIACFDGVRQHHHQKVADARVVSCIFASLDCTPDRGAADPSENCCCNMMIVSSIHRQMLTACMCLWWVQLLGAFLTEEAACEALAQATLAMQLEIAAAPADAVVRVAAAASKVPTSAAAAEETPPHALPAQQQQHKLADNAADTGGDPSGRPSCPTQSDGSPANAAAATVEAAATPLFVSEAQLDEAWQVAMRAINGAANFGASGTPTAGI